MKQYLKYLVLVPMLAYGVCAEAFQIRNTYPKKLICIEENKPHTQYTIPANKSKNFSNVPVMDVKTEGTYSCETADKMYHSICSVSDLQPRATFNTDDGSVSCSTPRRITESCGH